MKLFGFVAALFKARDDERESVREHGREIARQFFDGFREEMAAQTSELAVACRGRTVDQLLLEHDGGNGDQPPRAVRHGKSRTKKTKRAPARRRA